MVKADECDKDVALVLGLNQAVVAEQARGTSLRTNARALAWVAVLGGVLFIGTRPAGNPADRLPMALLHDAPLVQDRADMLLTAPDQSPKLPASSDPHQDLMVVKRDGSGVKLEKRLWRSAAGHKRRIFTYQLMSARSQALARRLNLAPSTSVLQLSSRYNAAGDLRSRDIRSPTSRFASGPVGEKNERTLQSERLEAIDAIRLLRQR